MLRQFTSLVSHSRSRVPSAHYARAAGTRSLSERSEVERDPEPRTGGSEGHDKDPTVLSWSRASCPSLPRSTPLRSHPAHGGRCAGRSGYRKSWERHDGETTVEPARERPTLSHSGCYLREFQPFYLLRVTDEALRQEGCLITISLFPRARCLLSSALTVNDLSFCYHSHPLSEAAPPVAKMGWSGYRGNELSFW